MNEHVEFVELEPLPPATMKYWRTVSEFEASTAACLMLEFAPPVLTDGLHVKWPAEVLDLTRWLYVEAKYPRMTCEYLDDFHGNKLRRASPPIFTRETLVQVAQDRGLAPRFLFHEESPTVPAPTASPVWLSEFHEKLLNPNQKRVMRLLQKIDEDGLDRHDIPADGTKSRLCEELDDGRLFTKSTFDSAWNEASKNGLLAIHGKAKYRPAV